MSAKNFYHTLYQTDSIFRLPNELWVVSGQPPATELPAEVSILVTADNSTQPAVADKMDFMTQLDALSAKPVAVEEVPIGANILSITPAVTTNLPEPVVMMPLPEPLPQSAPRPTTPSILPPLQQQARLPQLNHKVLLLADEELDPSNLLFLEKILKAVNLNINGVDLLNLHGVRDMNFAELLRGKVINHFITFGVPFERINLDIMMDRYSPVRFEGITFLMADSLPTIEADQNLKKRLWSSLQRVFLQR